MNNASSNSTARGHGAPDRGIEWEFQPSLQHLVVRADDGHPTWAETMPATFDSFNEPVKFREPLEGLSVRDIDEPEIFRVFFGETEPVAARA